MIFLSCIAKFSLSNGNFENIILTQVSSLPQRSDSESLNRQRHRFKRNFSYKIIPTFITRSTAIWAIREFRASHCIANWGRTEFRKAGNSRLTIKIVPNRPFVWRNFGKEQCRAFPLTLPPRRARISPRFAVLELYNTRTRCVQNDWQSALTCNDVLSIWCSSENPFFLNRICTREYVSWLRF